MSLGHAHPAIVKAIHDQSRKLWHISNLFDIPGQEKVAQKLIADTHFSYAFFCNSGAEANEAAIKLARKHAGKIILLLLRNPFMGELLERCPQQVRAMYIMASDRLLKNLRFFLLMMWQHLKQRLTILWQQLCLK